MKKPLLIFAGVVFLMILFFLFNPRYAEKRGALGEAAKTLVTADHHHARAAYPTVEIAEERQKNP